MPLSEFLRLAMEKLEAGKQKQSSNDTSSRNENDLVELVWEDGQISMLGQSSEVTRSPTLHSLPSNAARVCDDVDYILNDISAVVPSGHLDLTRNDYMVPWLSYPLDDDLRDYCSYFLPEISGVTSNGVFARNSSCEQAVSSLDNGRDAFKFSSCTTRPLSPWPQTSDPFLGSGVSDTIRNSTRNCEDAIFGNFDQCREVVNDSARKKMERESIIALPSNDSSLLNFSHFSRPVALVRANSGGVNPSVSSSVDGLDVKEKGSSAPRCSTPVKSVLIGRLNNTEKDTDLYVPSAPTMVKSRQLVAKEHKESFHSARIEYLCQETSSKNGKALVQSNTVNCTKGIVEPMVASSSVGSGNSADRVSYGQAHNSKRKCHDIEESECHSDDIGTESIGVKKATPARGGTASKRSRAAEVHNLSERRRRDRINEKMRALQELIPNCNKVDKASMLDEAIEYLKNLQLQVQVRTLFIRTIQIMSMGAGLYMPPPMMFPHGTQHMYPSSHLPHFPPMGVGVGMGMGMLDMNGVSPQCPMFPLPPMQGACFPSSSPGPANFPRFPGSNLPIYGNPSQGLQTTSAMVSSDLRVSRHNEVPSSSPKSNSEDLLKKKNPEVMHNAETSSSIDHRSDQRQDRNEVLDQSAEVQENNDQATDINSTTVPTSTAPTDISK